jgi:hypothetical protein
MPMTIQGAWLHALGLASPPPAPHFQPCALTISTMTIKAYLENTFNGCALEIHYSAQLLWITFVYELETTL